MSIYSLGAREQIAWVEEQGGFKLLGTNSMSANGEIVGYNAQITPQFSRNWQEILNSGADTPEIKSMVLGQKVLKFKLSFVPRNWNFLKYCTHPTVSNTPQSGYNEHTFAIANSIKSFQLEWANRLSTNEVITLIGCTIKKVSLKWNKGTGPTDAMVKVELDCVASDYTTGTSVTSLSAPTEAPLLFYNSKFTFNGSEIVEVNSGEITLDNGINEDDSSYCNDTYLDTLGEPIPTIKRYTCTMNVNQKDSVYLTAWKNGVVVPGATSVKFTKGTHDWALFTFTDSRLGVAPVPTTNTGGVNKLDVAIVPRTITITAEDANTY